MQQHVLSFKVGGVLHPVTATRTDDENNVMSSLLSTGLPATGLVLVLATGDELMQGGGRQSRPGAVASDLVHQELRSAISCRAPVLIEGSRGVLCMFRLVIVMFCSDFLCILFVACYKFRRELNHSNYSCNLSV
jgi:hypothetical protein